MKRKTDTKTTADKTAAVMDGLASHFAQMIRDGIADPSSWRKSWKELGAQRPTNVVTKHAYTGGNWLVLSFESMLKGWGHDWSTYNGWASLGGQVRKGERSTVILAPTPIVFKAEAEAAAKEGRSPRKSIIWKAIPVFNSAQVDGLPAETPASPQLAADLPAIQAWLKSTGASISHGKAYGPQYSPTSDVIKLPHPAQFDSASAYASTAAHEVGHWTGHTSRLDRPQLNSFGTPGYAREELVAELVSARISQTLGYEVEPSLHHGQYLASWLSVINDDPRALWTAASCAAKAVAFLDKLTAVVVDDAELVSV